MAVLNFCRAGQRSGSFVANAAAERSLLGCNRTARNAAVAHLESASISHKHTAAAASSSNAACNAAAGHGEGSPHIHTAAAMGLTTCDIAAGHGEGAAGYNFHTAAVISSGVAAGDDAAGDGFGSVLVQHPKAVGVWFKLVQHGRVAVGDGQVAAGLDHDHAAFVRAIILQHTAVQVEGDSAADRQRGVDFNVCYQLDDCSSTFQRSGQIVRRGNFGWCPLCQCRRGQQAQAQGQCHETAQNSFFHGFPPLLSSPPGAYLPQAEWYPVGETPTGPGAPPDSFQI